MSSSFRHYTFSKPNFIKQIKYKNIMSTISKFKVPTIEEVSPANQEIFTNLKSALGFVPNIYAAMANSKNALGNYLTFSNGATSFSKKEKEVIDLAVSQVNGCNYCLSAHTVIGKMNGFSDEQILELRAGGASWDAKYNVLAKISKSIAETRGNVDNTLVADFYDAGYNDENLVDLVIAAGIINITNTFHNLTDVEIDFPVAEEL